MAHRQLTILRKIVRGFGHGPPRPTPNLLRQRRAAKNKTAPPPGETGPLQKRKMCAALSKKRADFGKMLKKFPRTGRYRENAIIMPDWSTSLAC
jgi:hypothetical protein